ncbi:unnamed protein product [Urochloa humidicola]
MQQRCPLGVTGMTVPAARVYSTVDVALLFDFRSYHVSQFGAGMLIDTFLPSGVAGQIVLNEVNLSECLELHPSWLPLKLAQVTGHSMMQRKIPWPPPEVALVPNNVVQRPIPWPSFEFSRQGIFVQLITPMKLIELKIAWPPPTELKVASKGVDVRPLPWPFVCYLEAEFKLLKLLLLPMSSVCNIDESLGHSSFQSYSLALDEFSKGNYLQHLMVTSLYVGVKLFSDDDSIYGYSSTMSNEMQMQVLIYDWGSFMLIIVIQEHPSCKSTVHVVACNLSKLRVVHSASARQSIVIWSVAIEATCCENYEVVVFSASSVAQSLFLGAYSWLHVRVIPLHLGRFANMACGEVLKLLLRNAQVYGCCIPPVQNELESSTGEVRPCLWLSFSGYHAMSRMEISCIVSVLAVSIQILMTTEVKAWMVSGCHNEQISVVYLLSYSDVQLERCLLDGLFELLESANISIAVQVDACSTSNDAEFFQAKLHQRLSTKILNKSVKPMQLQGDDFGNWCQFQMWPAPYVLEIMISYKLFAEYNQCKKIYQLRVISTKLEQYNWNLPEQLTYEGRAWPIQLPYLTLLAGSSAKQLKLVTPTCLGYESSNCKVSPLQLKAVKLLVVSEQPFLSDSRNTTIALQGTCAFVQVATSQSICKCCLTSRVGVVLISLSVLQMPWDPGEILQQQRLGDKPCFKGGRMSGTYWTCRVGLTGKHLGCTWAKERATSCWTVQLARYKQGHLLHQEVVDEPEGIGGGELTLEASICSRLA